MLQERGRGNDGEDFTVFRALPHRNILHGEQNLNQPTNQTNQPTKPNQQNNQTNKTTDRPTDWPTDQQTSRLTNYQYISVCIKVGEQPFRAVMVKERKGSHHGQDSAERTEVFWKQNRDEIDHYDGQEVVIRLWMGEAGVVVQSLQQAGHQPAFRWF